MSRKSEDKAYRATQECLWLLKGVIALGVIVGIILGNPAILVASALVGGGGAALVFWAHISSMR